MHAIALLLILGVLSVPVKLQQFSRNHYFQRIWFVATAWSMRHNLAIMQQAVRLGQQGFNLTDTSAAGQEVEGWNVRTNHRQCGPWRSSCRPKVGCMKCKSYEVPPLGQLCAAARGRQNLVRGYAFGNEAQTHDRRYVNCHLGSVERLWLGHEVNCLEIWAR